MHNRACNYLIYLHPLFGRSSLGVGNSVDPELGFYQCTRVSLYIGDIKAHHSKKWTGWCRVDNVCSNVKKTQNKKQKRTNEFTTHCDRFSHSNIFP